MKCPNCGATIRVKRGCEEVQCEFCGDTFFIDNPNSFNSVEAEEVGYQFERGRQRAQAEISRNNTSARNTSRRQPTKKKRRTWLWVLGWIFIFPLPLTVLLVRNQKMNKFIKFSAIAVAWLLYLIIASGGGSRNSTSGTSDNDINGTRTTIKVTNNNIKSLKFSHNDNITVKVGETKSAGGYLSVDAKSSKDLTPEDVVFVSENPEIATISLKNVALNSFYYCNVTGVGAGETRVYATSQDGTIVSDYITVTVPQPIRIESIEIQNAKTNLVIGETTKPSITILPNNAEERIIWTSSDETVAIVDNNGTATAIGGGTTTIVASSPNGVTTSYTVNVDGAKHLMNLRVTHSRQDNVNIGDEWNYTNEINGSYVYSTVGIAPGENLTLHTVISELDDNPDIGENTTWYTTTEADITNGFTVTMDVYVTENGGRNSGQSAHFLVTYTFAPIN